MKFDIKSLLQDSEINQSFKKAIATAALRYIKNPEIIIISKNILSEKIMIDLLELKSLTEQTNHNISHCDASYW